MSFHQSLQSTLSPKCDMLGMVKLGFNAITIIVAQREGTVNLKLLSHRVLENCQTVTS